MIRLICIILFIVINSNSYTQDLFLNPYIGIDALPESNAPVCDIPLIDLGLDSVEVGDTIFDFRLFDINDNPVLISEVLALGKPILLISCSYTCPVFRNKIPTINELQSLYGDEISIYLIYTIEAHPDIDISPYYGYVNTGEQNISAGILYQQPSTYFERKDVVSDMLEAEDIQVPVLIDGPCNNWWMNFGTNPNSALLIDTNGIIYDAQPWLNRYPDDIFNSIDKLLGNNTTVEEQYLGEVTYPEFSDNCFEGEPGTTIYAGDYIMNNDYSGAIVDITVTDLQLLPGWNYSICTDICYPPGVDTANLILASGEEIYIGIYFYTDALTPGTSSFTMHIENRNIPGNSISYSITACTSSSNSFSIYPNPADDFLHIDANGNSMDKVYISNVSGQIVLQTSVQNDQLQLPVNNLADGMYFLNIQSGENIFTNTISIIHQ